MYGLRPSGAWRRRPARRAWPAGDVAISFTAAGATVAANLQGSDVVLLGATIDSLPFELWSIPSIKQYEQLKGTKLGVSRIGATTDFIARYLLKKWHLQPDREVAIFQTGSGPQVFAALKGGAVQSGVLSTGPETLNAGAAGFFRLADVSSSGLVYPFGPFAARQSFLKTHANLAMRFMKAYVEGIHRFKTDKAAALSVMEKYLKQKPTPATEKIYELYASRYFKRAPEATSAAIQTILEELSTTRPLPAGIAPQDLVLEARGAVIGHSRICNIDRIVYVKPAVYGQLPIARRYGSRRCGTTTS